MSVASGGGADDFERTERAAAQVPSLPFGVRMLGLARSELGVLAAVLLLSIYLVRGAVGIHGLGLSSGAILALHGAAIVLVYRSNSIINFAQIGIAGGVGYFFVMMTRYRPIFRLFDMACSSCVEEDQEGVIVLRNQVVEQVNYWLSAALALLLGFLVSWIVYLVLQRFRDAPRLVVTVATIFAASALGWGAPYLERVLISSEARERQLVMTAVPPRGIGFLGLTIGSPPVRLEASKVLTILVAAAALIATFLYFRASRTGSAIRAASENPARAATLGINVGSITKQVWWATGLLASAAGMLSAMTGGVGQGSAGSLDVSLIVRVLTVAVIARMASLPMALAGAFTLGIFEQAVQWASGSQALFDAALIVVIGAALAVQRQPATRADVQQASAWKADREIRPIPPELRPLRVVRKYVRTLSVVGFVVFLGLPWVLNAGQATQITTTLIYGIVGLSLLVLTGWAGQISLGQLGFAAVGGYVATRFAMPFPVALAAGAAAAALAAVLLGIPALRLRGLELAIITLAMALTTTSWLLNPDYLGKHLRPSLDRPEILGMDFRDPRLFYYLSLLILVLCVISVVGLRRSQTARILIGARDNEQAAQSFGIDIIRARLTAFALSGALAGIAGVMLAYGASGARPTVFPPGESLQLFLLAVIGGFGHTAGPLIGTAYRGILGLGFVSLPVPLLDGVGGLALLLFFGGGLSQVVFRVRDNMLRRVANRYGIVVPSLLEDIRASGTIERKAKILPKVRAGGRAIFVPRRYTVGGQWALDAERAEHAEQAARVPPTGVL